MMKDINDDNDDSEKGSFEEKNLDEEKIQRVNKCFDVCGLQRLSQSNISFLLEYCQVKLENIHYLIFKRKKLVS